MHTDRMGSTEENLEESFAGESQANRRYTFYARRAEEEDLHMIARIFRAAAESETIHAQCHLRVLGAPMDTRANLREAIKGENYEHTEMYPRFIEQAKEDGDKEARLCFSYAKSVEKRHEVILQEALSALEAGERPSIRRTFVCQVCGNVEFDSPPSTCPVCGNPKQVFREVR